MSMKEEAKEVFEIEKHAIQEISDKLDEGFDKAVNMIFQCRGKIVVTGMGKSGHVGNKMAATLASTGTPAFFMHPAEGMHGDLGMVMADDIVIMISNSGEAEEIISIIPSMKKIGVKMISITGKPSSTMARLSDVNLDISVSKEACPLGLAPTASTTATMAMGDALSVVLLKKRNFGPDDYAIFHPGGSLGKRLLTKVEDVMHSGKSNPVTFTGKPMKDALLEMTSKGLGAVSVKDSSNKLVGIITDGDLRRAIENDLDLRKQKVDEVMTKDPVTIEKGKLAAEAVAIMENRPSQIMVLPVVNSKKEPVGMIRIHDLVLAGVG